MLTVSISIGQNIKNSPMLPEKWESFKNDINSLFVETYIKTEFQGAWGDIPETSFMILGVLKDNISNDIERILSNLAREYSQDAIGLLVNSRESSLVFASTEQKLSV